MQGYLESRKNDNKRNQSRVFSYCKDECQLFMKTFQESLFWSLWEIVLGYQHSTTLESIIVNLPSKGHVRDQTYNKDDYGQT